MGKTILITGCSDNGLGAALAIAFHKAGYRVIASGRNLKKLGQATAAGCETVQLDVLSQDSITACVAELNERLGGKLDILLNNAGGMAGLPVLDLKLKNVRDVFELNVFSLIPLTQAFFPMLRAAYGWIVNNTSVAAVVSLPMQGAYNASKAAASSFTQALRLEMEPFGVKVVELRTGAVRSEIFQNVKADSNQLPENSPYAIAKDVINPHLDGSAFSETTAPAADWARQVVSDLSTNSPPIFVYRGTSASLVRWAQLLPLWLFDGNLSKRMGLDIFKKRLTAQQTKQ